MRRSSGLALLAWISVSAWAALAGPAAPALGATDPGTPGPFTAGKRAEQIPATEGRTLDADVYYPAVAGGGIDPAAGRLPAVVFGHGFSRSKDRYDVGPHLATRGFLVVQANFYPCGFLGCDHDRNANDMSAVIDWLIARNADPSSFWYDRLDTARFGTSGHSAGGGWALTAAGRDPRIAASAPLDPVDSAGLAAGALPGTRAATGITYSEPSSCNADASAEDMDAAAPAQKRRIKLVGANHCDPEKDSDFLGCGLTCGTWNRDRHVRYLRYVSGWFEYYLRCDATYHEWVWGERVRADRDAGLITYLADPRPRPPLNVAAQPAAGVRITRDAPWACGGVSAWRVYRRVAPAGPLVRVSPDLPVTATTWTDTTAAGATSYAYVARDVFSDFAGEHESADSNEAPVTTPGRPGEAGEGAGALRAARGAGTRVDLTFGAAPCATDHVAYWGVTAQTLAGPPAWTAQACSLGPGGAASVDTGPLAPGTMAYLVVAGNDAAVEGSYGRDSAGAERPEAAGLAACDYPQDLALSCAR